MSGQCLSPNDAGHALTPATHRCLGEPLPHQQANRMQAPPLTESHLWSEDIIRYYLQFPAAIPDRGVGTYTLLSLPPLSIYRSKLLARLACLIHAANVHSEPGSNPSIVIAYRTCCPRAEVRMTSQLKNLRCTFSIVRVNDFLSTTSTVSSNLTRKLPNCQRSKSPVTPQAQSTSDANRINHSMWQNVRVNGPPQVFSSF